MESTADLGTHKQAIRKQALANRFAQPEKDAVSRIIWDKFVALPEVAAATTLMLYVHMRNEVRTQPYLSEALRLGKRIVIPYCVDDSLELFHLEDIEELEIGTWSILEPRLLLRAQPGKRVRSEEPDVVMVPGVAFDRRGGRMGHGRGYYDKLLAHVRPDARLVAAAYECQVFPEVPMAEHDVFMDRVVTEQAVYEGRRHVGRS
jgi:5-formyltetrahydrofolate cyclo-ligase